MIREDFTQAWVTLALTDMEALQAMVLARSLQQVYTTRKICILISDGVTREMKYLLMQVFSTVIHISNDEIRIAGPMTAALNSVAKLWLWTLNQFSKCIFLSPSYLATNNCDNLFKYQEFSAAPNNPNGEQISYSMFVYQPEFGTFEKLLSLAGTIKQGDSDAVLNKFFKDWKVIEPKHLTSVFSVEGPKEMVDRNLNLDSNGTLPWLANSDIKLQSKATKKWLQIYFQHILPLFQRQTNEAVRCFIENVTKLRQLPMDESQNPESAEPEEDLADYKGTIAVVGMSCRFPGANSPEEYWKLLSEGREAIRKFPSDRVFFGGQADAREMEAGFLSCAIDEFDAKFFGISPREALLVDPQQRLLLEVTWESLEHAGINPQTLKDSDTGVYVGMWQQDYERIICESKKTEETAEETTGFLHIFLGNKYSATASRISFCLGLNGPAMAVESGCSSSLNGLHLACESLQTGETSLALVSGVNLILLPFNPFSGKAAEEESVVLSKDYRCKTFDESANGFVRAEACGVVVLKRFEDARRDGDNILAVVKGSAVNNDGTGTSFGTPNEKAQEKVYRAALSRANIKAKDVSFIETHGTGTAVGDPIELYAVGQAYSENRVDPLIVGSVKTNIGHCEAAAGIASLIKVILCMQHGAIPPHLNLKTLNPRIDLAKIPAVIPMELTPWNAKKRIAAISSFSMSATNAHVILQEAPNSRQIIDEAAESSDQLITISAKSEQALKDLCRMYTNFLQANPDLPLNDIAYISNTGRAHLKYRMAIVASDSAQLLTRLDKENYTQGEAPTLKAKVGFLFTGQGSQYLGMAQGLYNAFPAFRQAMDECTALFRESLDEDLQSVVWQDEKLLNQTLYCQPAIFCIEYSLLQLWSFYGIKPDYVLGHSVGEFAAAVCAGILTLQDAMKLVVARSKLVHGLPTGSMTAIRAPEIRVSELIKLFIKSEKNEAWIDIAAVNSSEEVVVSGNPDSVQRFEIFCQHNGVSHINIPATHAFHSRDMDSIMAEFGLVADTIEVGTLKCGYVSGTLARIMDPIEFGSNYWRRHLRDSVRFVDAVRILWQECKVFLEIGPQPILLGLTMASVDESSNGVFIPSLRRKDEAQTSFFAAASKLYVAGINFDWANVYGVRQKRVNLPLYPFQRQRYWYVDELAINNELTPLLHPLLGRQFLCPLPELVFCQTYRLKDLSYMEDHKVAEFVIVPVAAFLESFMAASREVLQGGAQNKFPITIENLAVEAALPLESKCRIQTLVASEGESEDLHYKLSLNRKIENHYDKWKRHASAVFTPSSKLPEAIIVDLEAIKERLTLRDSLEKSYKAIAEVGIQFGPRFQSVVSAWYGPADLLTQINLPAQHADYICHPIVLDAMIQTSALREYLTQTMDPQEVKKALYLPISIKKFTWLSRTTTETVYAHSSGQNGDVTLYTSAGEPLAIMEGLELVQTTISAVIRAIRADTCEVPDFMCDKWRQVLGKTGGRVDIGKIIAPSVTSPNVAEHKDSVSGYSHAEFQDATSCCNIACTHMFIQAMQECGWPWPPVGETITPELWRPLLPKTLNEGILYVYLHELVDREFLEIVNKNTFKVLLPLPSITECYDLIEEYVQRLQRHPVDARADMAFIQRFRWCLPLILQGKMTPFAYLFPDDESEPGGAHHFYKQSRIYAHQNTIVKSFFKDCLMNYEANPSKDGTLRILEIGAGSGSTAIPCIETLRELKIPFTYTFTDISPLFLSEAKKRLNLGSEVNYQVLNIEDDPLTQGFAPDEFDVVLAVEVIHATAYISESLANIKKVLKHKGLFILGEGFTTFSTHLMVFAMMEGWWRYKDFRVGSRMTALCSAETWERCLREAGFDSLATAPGVLLGAIGAINETNEELTKVEETKKKCWLIHDDSSQLSKSIVNQLSIHNRTTARINENWEGCLDEHLTTKANENLEGILFLYTNDSAPTGIDLSETQTNLLTPIFNVLQGYDKRADKCKVKPRIVLVTRGIYYIGDSEPGNPNGATASALLRVFANEFPNITTCVIDLDQAESSFEPVQILGQLWSLDGESTVAFRQNKMFVLRLVHMDKPQLPVQLPATDRFKFINPESGAFTDIEVGPRGKADIPDDSVELEVHACALNFRDIFMVLKPEGFSLPDDNSLGTIDSVGIDVSGVVSAVGSNVTRFQVGDPVFGMTFDGALASHTLVKEKVLMKIPESMTFVEASTIPCAFVTAHVSLVEVAKITAEDRILIHVASGGVGLASIQVVREVGAEIYATAGSKRKRAYLRSLGLKHVYHSRDISYGERIEKDTNGKGITVVLNSLTGPNFKETTLKLCTEGARFVEIAKINIWKPEEVEALRPDVKYTIVDLSLKDQMEKVKREREGEHTEEEWFQKLSRYIDAKIYTGLPSIVFQLSQIREAFYYFQKALHVGKVVVQIPKYTPTPSGKFIHKSYIFNEKSSYLITGGLGGIGIEVTKWMRTMGAKTIVLVGRSQPKDNVQRLIDSWNSEGSRLVVMQADVGDYEQCKRVLDQIEFLGLPALRGIMHAAGVLRDNFITNQSITDIQHVLKPKVYGGWHLHKLTLKNQMEFFVMFSSLSGILGMIGQCNHAGANRFLDALTHYRVQMGLPCTTINWGGWSDVGAAAHIATSAEVITGFRTFTPAQGIAALEQIMTSREVQVGVAEVIDWNIIKNLISQGHYFDEMKSDKTDDNKKFEKYDYLIDEIKAAQTMEERQEKIQIYIEAILKQTLNLPETEVLDIDQNFSEMGVDSLMAMEMKNRFQNVIGNRTMSISSLQENRTIRSLAAHLAQLMENEPIDTRPLPEIIAGDVILPEDVKPAEIEALKPSEFHNVLLTGVTGHLGIHCLLEALAASPSLTVHCIIRATSDEEALERLNKMLTKYRATLENPERVKALAGDLTKARLGLSQENYDSLSQEIDGIMHCAAKTNHLDGYSDGSRHDIRTHNVIGLVNLLKFASCHKTKPLLHASSIFSATKLTETGHVVEDFPEETEMGADIKIGYLLAKFVCEKLIAEAINRGMPIKVVRYPFIFGNSVTGHMPVENDHVWSIMVTSIRIRKIVRGHLNGLPIIAVDHASKVATHLFLSDTAEDGMYNMTVNSAICEDKFMKGLNELGISLEVVTFKEWMDTVFDEQDPTLMAPLAAFYKDGSGDTESKLLGMHGLAGEMENIQGRYFSEKMIRNFPDVENVVLSTDVIIHRQVKAHLEGVNQAKS